MRKLCAFLIGLSLFFASCDPILAFSLRSPFQTKTAEWEKIVDEVTGLPYKHRIYGNAEAVVMRVLDGDTFYARIEGVHPILGYEIGVRVFGIDTREMDDGGDKSKEFVKELMPPGTKVSLKQMRRGKYFRIVATVIVDGKSLADILLDNGMAYEYFGGTKRPKGWREQEFEEEESKAKPKGDVEDAIEIFERTVPDIGWIQIPSYDYHMLTDCNEEAGRPCFESEGWIYQNSIGSHTLEWNPDEYGVTFGVISE